MLLAMGQPGDFIVSALPQSLDHFLPAGNLTRFAPVDERPQVVVVATQHIFKIGHLIVIEMFKLLFQETRQHQVEFK